MKGATINPASTGRRKEAVARVRLVPGTGQWTVNGRTLDSYFPNKLHQQVVNEPFVTTDLVGRFDVIARIHGGGITGQAGALRLGGDWRYSGERRDQSIANSTVTVFEPAYSVLNLMARYQLSKNIWFGARLENALGEDYHLVSGYNTAGRGLFLTAGWQP